MYANKDHGSLGGNIKVHFAGSDYDHNCINSLQLANVNYRLYTVYYAICNKKLGDDFVDKTGVVKRQQQVFKHVIQDSGLFTLMFGGKKGTVQTKQTLIEWQDKLIAFVEQNGLNCTCVELDCQKVLGVKEAWFFRERMKKKMKNRIINVFHYEDGKKGLDSIISFSDYIALSIPELRLVKPKTFREDTYKLASYIKDKKPEIDIHLLGCTDKRMLQMNKFCTTADSSSWTGAYRYASIQGNSAHSIKKDVYDRYKNRYIDFIGEKQWSALTDSQKKVNVWGYISAEINKRVYEKYAGSQD